jgi:hypothetical protein
LLNGMLFSPRDDVRCPVDYRAVVQKQGGHLVRPCQALDPPATLPKGIGSIAATGTHHVRCMAGPSQRVVGSGARMPPSAPERPIPDVQLHDWIVSVSAKSRSNRRLCLDRRGQQKEASSEDRVPLNRGGHCARRAH